MLSTNTSKATGRKAIVNSLKEKHEKLFKMENLEKAPKFIPKMAYVPKTGDERVISFFPSEIMGGEDIYTEFVSRTLEPEDAERRLWKWPFNPEYETEYKKTEPHAATGHQQYLIPIAELIDVAESHRVVKKTPVEEPSNEKEEAVADEKGQLKMKIPEDAEEDKKGVVLMDAPISQMTIKDKAAIDWKKPVSDKPWLNDLIRETFNLK